MKGMTLYVTGVPMQAVKNREPFAVVLVREALVLCPLMGQEDFYAISLLDIQDVKTLNLTKVNVKVPSSLGSIPATIPYATAVEVTYTIPRAYGGLTHGLKWAVSESESAETWVDAILLASHEYKVG